MSDFLEFHKINFEISSFHNIIFEIMFAFCANFLFKIIKLFKSSVIYQEKLTAVVFFPTVEAK